MDELFSNQERPGYWTGYRGWAPSTVEWCEVNYELCSWIAEFWNSASSLAMVLAGVIGVVVSHRYGQGELRFVLAYLAIIGVGIGSILFHMTLLRPMQALDEVPMLYAAQTMLFCILENDSAKRKYGAALPLALGVHALIVTALVAFTSGKFQFFVFHASFGSLEFVSLGLVARMARRETDPTARRLYVGGFSSYVIALVCWASDIHFCEALRLRNIIPVNPQLHAWWHVFVSCGLYTLTVAGQHARLRVLAAESKGRELVPTIEVVCHVLPVARMKPAK